MSKEARKLQERIRREKDKLRRIPLDQQGRRNRQWSIIQDLLRKQAEALLDAQ